MTWKKYQCLLNIIATVIVAITVIGVLIISYNYLKIPDTKTQKIKIEYYISKNKNEQSNKAEIRKLDSILKVITQTSNNIQQKQLELIDDKSDENFFNKLYTAIVAIILAIAGFFGFKSISEIKSQAIEDAKKESTKISKKIAKKEAKEEFTRTFDTEYEAGVFAKAIQAMNVLLRTEIQSLDERVYALEQNGDNPDENTDNDNPDENDPDGNNPTDENPTLERPNNENSNLATDTNLVEPENPFENE